MVHLVGISGSLRKGSVHTGLLRCIAAHLETVGHSMDVVVPHLPLFSEDLEASPLPEAIEAYRLRIKRADGFLFASPENNYSFSAAMKNALDWGSRGSHGNLFNDKPAAVLSAGGGQGGMRSQMHLRDVGVALNLHMLNHPTVAVRMFDAPPPINIATGEVLAEGVKQDICALTNNLLDWTLRLKTSKASNKWMAYSMTVRSVCFMNVITNSCGVD